MARRGRMPDHSHLSQLLQVEAPAQHRAVGALGWVQIQGVQLCPPERIAPLPGAQGELKGPVLHPSVTSLHTHFAGKPGVFIHYLSRRCSFLFTTNGLQQVPVAACAAGTRGAAAPEGREKLQNLLADTSLLSAAAPSQCPRRSLPLTSSLRGPG
ncbi:uncharacterized protein LOC141916027 isoform X4 [Strix aluco]|uniref:uncharacterized protein LOC141916027 isoform X4 n=1 Tax=Strix aluco TaxID=111821 RepID=UPI003DA4DA29